MTGTLFPEPDDLENISAVMLHANTISHGALGLGLPISIFSIILIVGIILKSRVSIVFTTASVIFTIIVILETWMHMLNPLIVIIGAIMSGLGAIWVKLESSN